MERDTSAAAPTMTVPGSQVKSAMLLELLSEAEKEAQGPSTVVQPGECLLNSIQFNGETAHSLLRQMRTSGDLHQAAAAQKLESSISSTKCDILLLKNTSVTWKWLRHPVSCSRFDWW